MNKLDIQMPGGENAVLLIHGLTGSPYELMYMAKRLNKEGFSVMVPCLSGHGTSADDLIKTGWKDWYQTVEEAFAELKRNHYKVSVSGLCMGAVLALKLAADVGDDVVGISLMSTTLFYDGWNVPWFKFLINLLYFTPFRNIASYQEREPFGIKNERLRRLMVNAMKSDSGALSNFPCTGMYEQLKLVKVVRKEMNKITSPTQIIHSIEDDVASLRNVDYIEKHISSKHIDKVLLDNCYHMIPFDNQRELAADQMIGFFKRNIK
jgi:carboxylesterase